MLDMGEQGGWRVPFLTALAFSALRWACAGFMDFSFGIVAVAFRLFPRLSVNMSLLWDSSDFVRFSGNGFVVSIVNKVTLY